MIDDFGLGDGCWVIMIQNARIKDSIAKILNFEGEGEIREDGLEPVDDDRFGGHHRSRSAWF